MADTGQVETQAPHSTQTLSSTFALPSTLIAETGHALSHAPQATQAPSSTCAFAIFDDPQSKMMILGQRPSCVVILSLIRSLCYNFCGYERGDLLHLLIDYENVNSRGLAGADRLGAEDSVSIFYSDSCRTMERGRLSALIASRCSIDICKLKKTGKNALDFYIASRAGELVGSKSADLVGIISKDSGFEAVVEYWAQRRKADRISARIVLAPTIAGCFDAVAGISTGSSSTVIVRNFFARINERRADSLLAKMIGADADDAARARVIAETYRYQRREMYLEMMRSFGIAKGLALYRAMRSEM